MKKKKKIVNPAGKHQSLSGTIVVTQITTRRKKNQSEPLEMNRTRNLKKGEEEEKQIEEEKGGGGPSSERKNDVSLTGLLFKRGFL